MRRWRWGLWFAFTILSIVAVGFGCALYYEMTKPGSVVEWREVEGELVVLDGMGHELKLTITFDGDMLVEPKETKP